MTQPMTDRILVDEASGPAINVDPWLAVEYPLSVQELRRLTWLQSKVAATEFLDQHGLYTKPLDAQRLAFSAYLFTSGRLSEHVGVRLEGDRS